MRYDRLAKGANDQTVFQQFRDEPLQVVRVELVENPIETADRRVIRQLTTPPERGIRRHLPVLSEESGEGTQVLISSRGDSETVSLLYRTSAENRLDQLYRILDDVYGDSAKLSKEVVTLEGLLEMGDENDEPNKQGYRWRNTGNRYDHELTKRTTEESLFAERGRARRPFVGQVAAVMSNAPLPALTSLTLQRSSLGQRDRERAINSIMQGVKTPVGAALARLQADFEGESYKKDYEDLSRELQHIVDALEEKDMTTTTWVSVDSIWFGAQKHVPTSRLRDAFSLANEWSELSMTQTDPDASLRRIANMTVQTNRSWSRRARDALPLQFPNNPSILCGRGETWLTAFVTPTRLSAPAKRAFDLDPGSSTPTRLP